MRRPQGHTDAAVVLEERHVANVIAAVLDAPMGSDGDRGLGGGERRLAGVQRHFLRRVPIARLVFLYGFPKNSRSNITEREREALSTAAAFITATDKQLADLIAKGGVFELECEKS